MGEQADAGIGFHVARVFGEAADQDHRPALMVERVRDERTERMSGIVGTRFDNTPARHEARQRLASAPRLTRELQCRRRSLRPSARTIRVRRHRRRDPKKARTRGSPRKASARSRIEEFALV